MFFFNCFLNMLFGMNELKDDIRRKDFYEINS